MPSITTRAVTLSSAPKTSSMNAFLMPAELPTELTNNSISEIKAIVPRLSFSGLISHGESTISFIGDAIDPIEQKYFGNSLQILSGNNLSRESPLHLIAGEGLANSLGLKIGDQVVLFVRTVSGGVNAIEMTVEGIFNTVSKAYDDNALRIPIETAQKLLRTQNIHSWIVLLNDTEQTDQVLNKLNATLPPKQYEVVPWYHLSDFYNKTIELFSKQVWVIKLIIALIIMLSISNMMTTNIMERVGEIGTTMALGIKKREIMRGFFREALLIGCTGGLLGILLAMLLADIISKIGIPMPPPPGMTRGYIGQIIVTTDSLIESFILVVVTTIIAAIFPTWKSTRIHIVDALRHNR